jgi:hypothetical protein
LRKTNLVSKLLSILKSMAVAVSLRPVFARKFGNIELMSILPSRLQDSPGKNTNPALDQCRWRIQACKHYSYPVSWSPKEEHNSGSSGEREGERLPASVLAIAV